MFPSFDNRCTHTNKVLFYDSKLKKLNHKFIEKVLNCSMKLNAEEEQESIVGLNDIKNILKDIGAKDIGVLDRIFDERQE